MFTELSGITEETGLSFDGEGSLYGYIGKYGTVVSDISGNGIYRVDMFFSAGDAPELRSERKAAVTELVNSLAESLPKNTVMSQSCEDGYVRVDLDRYSLLQENVVYLTEFLDKLADGLGDIMPEGADYKLLYDIAPQPAEKIPDGAVRVRLGFDGRSVLGILGALIGAAAMVVIAVLTVNADLEISTFELKFEVSTYILSAITAAVIFADYRFIARKLDACGVIVCPVFTLGAVVLSGLGAGVRACAKFAEVSFMDALRGFPDYLARYEAVGSFMFGYITRGLILAVVACIGICIFYFSRHPEETVRSERIAANDENPFGKRSGRD